MKLSQRRIGLALLAVVTLGAILILLLTLTTGGSTEGKVASITACVATAALLIAYWRGWKYAGHALVVVATLVVALPLSSSTASQTVNLAILVPPILALIYAGSLWVLGSALGIISIILARTGFQTPYAVPTTLVLFFIIVAGLILSRLATDNAKELAEANARAEDALARSERQAQELERRAAELEERNEQQQHLLDLVATLEMPAVELAEGVLLAPIVGHTDTRRAQALTTRLLQDATEHRARLIILDIAGVTTMDTAVAKALLNTGQALRLLGCEVAITGISAAVAMTLTHLGIGLEGIATWRSPHEALQDHRDIAPSRELASRAGV
jgi:rsbT co-antagonist protein RsbR